MPQSKQAKEYVQQVCEQIRWKKAHTVVKEELLAHIEDQQEAYEAAGATAEEAEILAVEEMGSPLETGSRFDRLYRPRVEWNVLLLVGLLLAMGVVLRVTLLGALGEEFHFAQDLWGLLVGLAMMALGYWLDYTRVLSGGIKTAVFGMVFIAISSFIIQSGIEVNGAYGSLLYLALLWPLIFCAFVYGLRGQGSSAFLYSFMFMFFSFYFFVSGQMVGILLILGTSFVILFFALWKNWLGCSRWWVCIFLCFPLALTAFILDKPYRVQRMYGFLNPYSDPLGTGYMPIKIISAVQEAHWIGPGSADLGFGMLTDYLLTTALNHFGWIAILLILLVYVLLLAACYYTCRKVKSMMGKMVAITIITEWSIQLFFYVCSNFTVLQLGNYPLLFVQGNLSMICNLFLLGVLLSVYKTGAVYKDSLTKRIVKLPKRYTSLAHKAGEYLLSLDNEETAENNANKR